jgi:hypothetical protein
MSKKSKRLLELEAGFADVPVDDGWEFRPLHAVPKSEAKAAPPKKPSREMEHFTELALAGLPDTKERTDNPDLDGLVPTAPAMRIQAVDKPASSSLADSEARHDLRSVTPVTSGLTSGQTEMTSGHDPSDPSDLRSMTPVTPGLTSGLTSGQNWRLTDGEIRIMHALWAVRDREAEDRTQRVTLNTLASTAQLSPATAKRTCSKLQRVGLIYEEDELRARGGGSIYVFKPGFQAALLSKPIPMTSGQTSGQTSGHSPPLVVVSSSSLDKELLQSAVDNSPWAGRVDVDTIVEHRNRDRLDTYAKLERLLDVAAACEEQYREQGKPMPKPVGFLVSRLKAGYCNPPPGWKSPEDRAIEAELAESKQIAERTAKLFDQRVQIAMDKLTDGQRRWLTQQARLRVPASMQGDRAEEVLNTEWDRLVRQYVKRGEAVPEAETSAVTRGG